MKDKIIETLRQFNDEFQEDVIADFYIEEIAARIDSLYPTLNRDKVMGIFNEFKSGIINLEMIEELERGAWIVIKPTWERCLKQLTKGGEMKTAEELRTQFQMENGDPWENSQGEPDIDYVMWLEEKLLNKLTLSEGEIIVEAGSHYRLGEEQEAFIKGAKWALKELTKPKEE
jgi:hypothetical protein